MQIRRGFWSWIGVSFWLRRLCGCGIVAAAGVVANLPAARAAEYRLSVETDLREYHRAYVPALAPALAPATQAVAPAGGVAGVPPGEGELRFTQDQGEAQSRTSVRGTGPFAFFNRDDAGVDRSVPGKNLRGESSLSLRPGVAPQELWVVADIQINDKVQFVTVRTHLHVEAPAKFSVGDWSALLRGDAVEFAYTAEGWEKMKTALGDQLAQTARSLHEPMRAQAQKLGAQLSDLKVEQVEAPAPESFAGSLRDGFRASIDSLRVKLRCDLTVNR